MDPIVASIVYEGDQWVATYRPLPLNSFTVTKNGQEVSDVVVWNGHSFVDYENIHPEEPLRALGRAMRAAFKRPLR